MDENDRAPVQHVGMTVKERVKKPVSEGNIVVFVKNEGSVGKKGSDPGD